MKALSGTGLVAIALGAMAMLSPRWGAPGGAGGVDAGPPPLTGARLRAAARALLDRDAPFEDWQRLGEEAVPVLREVVADARAPDAVRCRAAFALAQQRGPEAVADLEPLLQDPREALRLGAARGLGQSGGDDARKALEDRLELEEAAVVREAIQRILTLMQP